MKDLFVESSYACHVPDRRMDGHLLSFELPAIVDDIRTEVATSLVSLTQPNRIGIVVLEGE